MFLEGWPSEATGRMLDGCSSRLLYEGRWLYEGHWLYEDWLGKPHFGQESLGVTTVSMMSNINGDQYDLGLADSHSSSSSPWPYQNHYRGFG